MTIERLHFETSNAPIVGTFCLGRTAATFDLDAPYQRGHVWGVQRKRDLIESLLRGLPTAAIIVNDRHKARTRAELDGVPTDFADVNYGAGPVKAIVDGKQRITAVRDFVSDRFTVPAEWFGVAGDAEGMVIWSDLPEGKRTDFEFSTTFTVSTASVPTLAEEERVFDLINTAGVAQGAEADGDML